MMLQAAGLRQTPGHCNIGTSVTWPVLESLQLGASHMKQGNKTEARAMSNDTVKVNFSGIALVDNVDH